MPNREVGDTEFGVQVGIGFLGNVTVALAGLLGSIVVARIIGPTGYGVFYISVAISNLLENLISGWANACRKRMTETQFDESEALGSVFLTFLVILFVVTPLSFLTLGFVTENPFIPVVVPVLLGTKSIYRGLQIFLSGRENFSMSIWSNAVKTITQAVGKVVLVVLGFGVWGILGGTVMGFVVVIPALLYWIKIRPKIPSVDSLKSIASFAKWSIPEGFVGSALSRMDIILLGWLASAGLSSQYQIGMQITLPAMFVFGAIQSGLMGRISNLESRDEEWESDVWNSLAYGGILAVPIFFGGAVLGEEIAVTIFSSQYEGAGVFVAGLALYRVITTQTGPFGAIIAALDRPDISFRISLVAFALNISLGIGLYFSIGAVGIVIATVLVQFVKYLLVIYAANLLADIDFIVTSPFVKQVASGAVMGAVVWIAKATMGFPHWWSVFVYTGIGALIYGVCIVLAIPHFRATAYGIYRDFQRNYVSE